MLQRTVDRQDILKQAEKLMDELASSRSFLELQYTGEEGIGLGPTLEFYSLVSKELQRADLELWRGDVTSETRDDGTKGPAYVFSRCGLFPAPLGRGAKSAHVTKVKTKFRFIGKFMAKTLMDFRMVRIKCQQFSVCSCIVTL